ncbi:MAG TPA: hypothetical protein VE669_04750 [Actinomycetota bacterium]|jgi:Ca2+-binding RTX toxin-like protein|nr:hypothetical protein [Actinomycetota bacterium]
MARPRRREHRRGLWVRIALAGALAIGATIGLTASNVVPLSRADDDSRPATPDDVKPVECAAIVLSVAVSGGGTVDGTPQADLVTGGPGGDTIDGRQGDDCVLGGGGDDLLRGGAGFDVCVGGPGADTFHNTCDVQVP